MTLLTAYLWLNAVLYAVFALWCTFARESTAQSIGYLSRSNAGNSEYLTVYGGLQWGMAVMFATLAAHAAPASLAASIAVGLYVPIVAYRWITIARFAPVGSLLKGVAVMETLLLAGALALWFTR